MTALIRAVIFSRECRLRIGEFSALIFPATALLLGTLLMRSFFQQTLRAAPFCSTYLHAFGQETAHGIKQGYIEDLFSGTIELIAFSCYLR